MVLVITLKTEFHFFLVVAVDCIDDVLSLIVVVELICVVVPMIRWRVG